METIEISDNPRDIWNTSTPPAIYLYQFYPPVNHSQHPLSILFSLTISESPLIKIEVEYKGVVNLHGSHPLSLCLLILRTKYQIGEY